MLCQSHLVLSGGEITDRCIRTDFIEKPRVTAEAKLIISCTYNFLVHELFEDVMKEFDKKLSLDFILFSSPWKTDK